MSNKRKTHDDEGEETNGTAQSDSPPAPSPENARHPIEAALEEIDEAVRASQGGKPGSGVYSLLAIVAAQIGVKVPPPA